MFENQFEIFTWSAGIIITLISLKRSVVESKFAYFNRKYYFGVLSRDFHCMKSGGLPKECRFSAVTNVSVGLYVHVDILVYLLKGRGKVKRKKEKPAQYSVVWFVFLRQL